ncbi:MAG: hypothetical protein E4G96_04880 [Chrysiogenales bacterium]|nr:MAG: hypothetical protein E4G96_04880 [Chrysiogenales bacterium]
MLKKFAEEIFRKILEHNSKINHESIPHSDSFEKEIRSLIGIDKPDFDRIIRVLKDSHWILSFEIIKEDRDNEIKRVDGYVEADLQTVRKLKNYFQKLLMDEYEKQFNKRMLVHQIVKDIYTRPSFYKNTPIGQIGNKAIMLDEYENLIERNFTEFTESWKLKKFSEVLTPWTTSSSPKRTPLHRRYHLPGRRYQNAPLIHPVTKTFRRISPNNPSRRSFRYTGWNSFSV